MNSGFEELMFQDSFPSIQTSGLAIWGFQWFILKWKL